MINHEGLSRSVRLAMVAALAVAASSALASSAQAGTYTVHKCYSAPGAGAGGWNPHTDSQVAMTQDSGCFAQDKCLGELRYTLDPVGANAA